MKYDNPYKGIKRLRQRTSKRMKEVLKMIEDAPDQRLHRMTFVSRKDLATINALMERLYIHRDPFDDCYELSDFSDEELQSYIDAYDEDEKNESSSISS